MLQEVYEALETRDLVLVLMDATRQGAAGGSDSPRSQKDETGLSHPTRCRLGRKEENPGPNRG